jgi:hypothetical protein
VAISRIERGDEAARRGLEPFRLAGLGLSGPGLGGLRRHADLGAVDPQEAGQPGFERVAGQHEGEEGEAIGPSADGNGHSEGKRLERAQPIGLAPPVLRGKIVEARALVAAEGEREDAAGGGKLDPGRREGPVFGRESRPEQAGEPTGGSGCDADGQRHPSALEAGVETGEHSEQDGGEQSERHGANPADQNRTVKI